MKRAIAGLATGLAVNVVQQEIGIMSGMQKGFSWDSLAEAGVGAVVGAAVGGIAGSSATSTSWLGQGSMDADMVMFAEQVGKAEITALFSQVIDKALGLQKHLDWGQFVTAIADTLITPNGKANLAASNIPLQMSQDITDTLVDDGIESLSQHQPLSATMEAANILGTAIGDGLVYGGRDIASSYRENKSLQPLADSLNTDLKLGNPSASLNLGVNGFDLTVQDIYGPAMQSTPQASNTPSNPNASTPAPNSDNYSRANSMTQQTPSPAEQAASQAAANTQAQLQQARGVQNGVAANSNSLVAANSNSLATNDNSFFNQLLSQPSQPTGFLANHPKLNNFVNQAEDTASMLGNFLMNSPPSAALEAIGTGVLAAASITKSIVSSKWMFGLFGGLDAGVQNVVGEANNLVINASSPAEIAWGYGSLSSRQAKLLTQLTESSAFIQVYKSDINTADLAALTAETGDEFGLFTLGSRRIIVRGTAQGLDIDPILSKQLLSEDWTWSAHTHPGVSDNVLMASGDPGDRAALQAFGQTQSLILNSVGRQSVFDMENNYLITNESRYNPTLGSGY